MVVALRAVSVVAAVGVAVEVIVAVVIMTVVVAVSVSLAVPVLVLAKRTFGSRREKTVAFKQIHAAAENSGGVALLVQRMDSTDVWAERSGGAAEHMPWQTFQRR